MKRYLPLGMMVLTSLLMTGCATRKFPYQQMDLTEEKWRQEVVVNADAWAKGADTWFLTNDPNQTQLQNEAAPLSDTIATMMVHVPMFTKVKIRGTFQTQIFGNDDRNTVFVNGPNTDVGQVVFKVKGDTLYVVQRKNSANTLKRVIVRIGIADLYSLEQVGNGSIEVVRVRSSGLSIKSSGCGNIYLSGNVNLNKVMQAGCGSINIFGANTPALEIRTTGEGAVNIIGNVGINQIIHRGRSDISIIGANSDRLKVDADGRGKISVYGHVNLTSLVARGATRVYLDKILSDDVDIQTFDEARVGVKGRARKVTVNSFQLSLFQGRYLCSQNTFARAMDNSHMNVAVKNKIFASADQYSSIYYYGPAGALSRFVNNNGATIIPVGATACR